jgi:hypothetical protein
MTAAAASADLLSIVTLTWSGQNLRLAPSATAFFHLESDDQAAVRRLANDLVGFLVERSVPTLIVRRGPDSGPRRSSRGAVKIETILQLMPLTCVHVHVQRLNAWVNSRDWLLPLPQPRLRSTWRDKQELAIQTAAYGIACVLSAGSRPARSEEADYIEGTFVEGV